MIRLLLFPFANRSRFRSSPYLPSTLSIQRPNLQNLQSSVMRFSDIVSALAMTGPSDWTLGSSRQETGRIGDSPSVQVTQASLGEVPISIIDSGFSEPSDTLSVLPSGRWDRRAASGYSNPMEARTASSTGSNITPCDALKPLEPSERISLQSDSEARSPPRYCTFTIGAGDQPVLAYLPAPIPGDPNRYKFQTSTIHELRQMGWKIDPEPRSCLQLSDAYKDLHDKGYSLKDREIELRDVVYGWKSELKCNSDTSLGMPAGLSEGQIAGIVVGVVVGFPGSIYGVYRLINYGAKQGWCGSMGR
jgi:hypothetical protein